MRGTRWLLIAAIGALLFVVAATYRIQKILLKKESPPKPAALAPNLEGTRGDFEWSQTAEGRPKVQVRASNLRQIKDTGVTELDSVELRLFRKGADEYDLIKSSKAEFRQSEGRLYAPGEVEITLRVPVEGTPARRLVSIRSSGVNFETKTGKAVTDRPTQFTFEHGDGRSRGASYDPALRELHLQNQVELDWKSPGAHAKRMKIESGELTYRETLSAIWLTQWARLTRDSTVIDAAGATIMLKDGVIKQVDAQKAHGRDHYPNRQLEYAADQLQALYSESGQVEKISGQTNARLFSRSEPTQTTMTADRVELDFAEQNDESVLAKALATGNGRIEAKPLDVSAPEAPETRVLQSAIMEMKMRPGGKEIDTVVTHAPGHVQFLPNRPSQRWRRLDGDRMWITYGPQNQIQSFRAANVTTETQPSAEERATARTAPRPSSRTASKGLNAEFELKSGRLIRMEQWDGFTYQQGDRKARAAKATMDSDHDLITLQTGARMWDATGSTSADIIRMEQETGNFMAEGRVNSSRQPDRKKPSSEMLSGDEPLQAIAQRMTSANRNRLVHYEGQAVLWQGSDRIQADRIDIDRDNRRLTARGRVVTQFVEQCPAAVFTTVKASELVYTEQDRLANYTGGVVLDRPGLQVKSAELRAFLAESGKKSDSGSRLEKAYADGRVEIVQVAADRIRKGTGEHGEYYPAEEKIILRGGEAQLADNKRGNTRGAELTYFAGDDRLLVTGAPTRPVVSRIRRKHL